MSTSLRDFLKQKAALYTVESEKNRLIIEEWQAAVERLFRTGPARVLAGEAMEMPGGGRVDGSTP